MKLLNFIVLEINWANVISSLFYSLLGIVVLTVSFIVWDLLTPKKLWKEIVENKNSALAILAAGFIVGIAIIIASAIHP